MFESLFAVLLMEGHKTDACLDCAHLEDEAFCTAYLVDAHYNFVVLLKACFNKAKGES